MYFLKIRTFFQNDPNQKIVSDLSLLFTSSLLGLASDAPERGSSLEPEDLGPSWAFCFSFFSFPFLPFSRSFVLSFLSQLGIFNGLPLEQVSVLFPPTSLCLGLLEIMGHLFCAVALHSGYRVFPHH